MWWIIGFVVLCVFIAVVIQRRGPGDGRSEAHRSTDYDAFGPGGGGDGGGGT